MRRRAGPTLRGTLHAIWTVQACLRIELGACATGSTCARAGSKPSRGGHATFARIPAAKVVRAPAVAGGLPAAPLAHGAVGNWDEVAVGVLIALFVVAYALWFYLTSRRR